MKFKNFPLKFFPIGWALIFFCAMPNFANGEKLMSATQVFVKTDKNEPINPAAAEHSADGGLIIGGSAASDAWAVRLDEQGNKIWEYRTGYREKYGYPLPPAASFQGVTPLADGTTYLCGNIPRPRGSGLPASVLTHLNNVGTMISEKFVMPDLDKNITYVSSSLDSCTGWREGLLTIGRALGRESITNDDTSVIKNYYWLRAIDSAGNLKWERLISFRFGALSVVVSRDISFAKVDSKIFFSASDTNQTDVICLDENGNLIAQTRIDGYFRLVRQFSGKGVQLIGFRPISGETRPGIRLIDLNPTLGVVRSVDDGQIDSFFPGITFKTKNNLLLTFGKGAHSLGKPFRGEMLLLDQNLQVEQRVDLEQDGIDDAGQIWVASPRGDGNEFSAVKLAINLTPHNTASSTSAFPADFIRGIVVQTIRHQ